MGASQPGLRSMESRQSSRNRLPNGDDLPCHMEDAPIDRISENQGDGTSAAQSTRSGSETDREGVRRSSAGVLPIREDSERRSNRWTEKGIDQGSISRRFADNSSGRTDASKHETETSTGVSGHRSESGLTKEGPPKADGSTISSSSSEKTSKNCFLDKTRPCGPDCTAFDALWKLQPCALLRALKVTSTPIMPPPPKVKP